LVLIAISIKLIFLPFSVGFLWFGLGKYSRTIEVCPNLGGFAFHGVVLKRRRFKGAGFRALGNLRLFKMIGKVPIERHARVSFSF